MARSKSLLLDVNFGGVSIGDAVARVGVRVARGPALPLAEADRCLCGKRLTGRIRLGANGEAEGQKRMKGMRDAYLEIDGVFDVKRFGVGPKEISFGLAFSIGDIEVSDLAQFAKRSGRLEIDDVEELPEGEEADGDDDEADDEGGTLFDADEADQGDAPARKRGRKPAPKG
jgi:hypothetical protein